MALGAELQKGLEHGEPIGDFLKMEYYSRFAGVGGKINEQMKRATSTRWSDATPITLF